jgi:RND family efflux transporter MFP subunit
MKIFDFFKNLKNWQKIILIIILIIILLNVFGKKTNRTEKFAQAENMDLTQLISVTGSVQATKSMDLAFKTSGIVSNISVKVGDKVKAGQMIASLENSGLLAQRKQAQSQVDGQNAKLEELKLGARPEDVAVSQSSLDKAKIDLSNYAKTAYTTINEAYNVSNNIFRKEFAPLFEYSPGAIEKYSLSYYPCDSNTANSLSYRRQTIDDKLSAWQKDIQAYDQLMISNPIYVNYKEEQIEDLINKTVSYMSYFDSYLSDINKTLVIDCDLSPTELSNISSYRSFVPTYISSFNTEFSAVKSSKQTIDAQKATVASYKNQLILKQAGGTSEQVAYQESQVKSAQANLELVNSQIADTYIIAPIDGVITAINTDQGEVATAGKTYVSMISSDPFKIESYINETDIAKIAVGNDANITFDAFGSTKQFHGKITLLDPAQSVVEGVVSYKATFSITDFTEDIKPGMTANIDIITAQKQNVLAIPTRAISKRQGKAFVTIKKDNANQEIEIKIGIKGDNGNTEVLEGLSLGEKVLLN